MVGSLYVTERYQGLSKRPSEMLNCFSISKIMKVKFEKILKLIIEAPFHKITFCF